MNNAAKIKSLETRIIALETERNDPTCLEFPAARDHVDRELDKAWRELRAAKGLRA